jgi:hypothetical protein
MTSISKNSITAKNIPINSALGIAKKDESATREHEARVLLVQKKAASRLPQLPAVNPSIEMSMAMICRNLGELVEIRCNDSEWRDKEDCNVDLTIDLVLSLARKLRTSNKSDFDQLLFDWVQLSSVVDLAKAAFSRPDSRYGRRLSHLSDAFRVLGEMMEIAQMEVTA